MLNCVFMVERNVKKLLLKALKETGDDPEEVQCEQGNKPHRQRELENLDGS